VGLVGPWLTGLVGWRGTLLIAALACLVFAVVLEPLRSEFDSDRIPTQSFRLSDFHTTIAGVLGMPPLRRLSMACFAFNGLQTGHLLISWWRAQVGHGLVRGLRLSMAWWWRCRAAFWGGSQRRVHPEVVMCWLRSAWRLPARPWAARAHWPLVQIEEATVMSATCDVLEPGAAGRGGAGCAVGRRGAARGACCPSGSSAGCCCRSSMPGSS